MELKYLTSEKMKIVRKKNLNKIVKGIEKFIKITSQIKKEEENLLLIKQQILENDLELKSLEKQLKDLNN